MKENVNTIARKISRLSSTELDELTFQLLNEHDMSVTIYRLKPMVENNNCDLILMKTGGSRLQIVKSIKEIFGLGLKDAKNIVDNIPYTLKEYIDVDEAEKIKEQLEEFGATLEINYHI